MSTEDLRKEAEDVARKATLYFDYGIKSADIKDPEIRLLVRALELLQGRLEAFNE